MGNIGPVKEKPIVIPLVEPASEPMHAPEEPVVVPEHEPEEVPV